MTKTKKILGAAVAAVSLAAMFAAPVSQASSWAYRHHWHPAGRRVSFHGCRRIVQQRYCRLNRNNVRHCYVERHVRRTC